MNPSKPLNSKIVFSEKCSHSDKIKIENGEVKCVQCNRPLVGFIPASQIVKSFS